MTIDLPGRSPAEGQDAHPTARPAGLAHAPDAASVLAVVDWRRRVHALYATVRRLATADPTEAHAAWIAERDDLFARHPASPLTAAERAEFTGLPVAPYDPAVRFEVAVLPDDGTRPGPAHRDVATGTDGVVPYDRIGSVDLPGVGVLDVWSLGGYGGGVFLPLRDPNPATYGGGRYVLDTIKGADLGPEPDETGRTPLLVVDLNFAYNPSCAYDPAWECPLAPVGNVVTTPLDCGELMAPG